MLFRPINLDWQTPQMVRKPSLVLSVGENPPPWNTSTPSPSPTLKPRPCDTGFAQDSRPQVRRIQVLSFLLDLIGASMFQLVIIFFKVFKMKIF